MAKKLMALQLDLTGELAIAVNAARLAGHFLAGRRPTVDRILGRDIKLVEDREAEALILAQIRKASDLPILTEEAGWVGTPPHDGGVYWAVDPIDGSFNYVNGIPLCCVSIALCRGTESLAGCVYDFQRDELFAGSVGSNLSINGNVCSASQRPERKVLATGFPVGGAQTTQNLELALGQWSKIRMLGSAALSLAWVAAGRLDAYQEHGIYWWDVAAGLALVRAAGGRTSVAKWTNGNASHNPPSSEQFAVEAERP